VKPSMGMPPPVPQSIVAYVTQGKKVIREKVPFGERRCLCCVQQTREKEQSCVGGEHLPARPLSRCCDLKCHQPPDTASVHLPSYVNF